MNMCARVSMCCPRAVARIMCAVVCKCVCVRVWTVAEQHRLIGLFFCFLLIMSKSRYFLFAKFIMARCRERQHEHTHQRGGERHTQWMEKKSFGLYEKLRRGT